MFQEVDQVEKQFQKQKSSEAQNRSNATPSIPQSPTLQNNYHPHQTQQLQGLASQTNQNNSHQPHTMPHFQQVPQAQRGASAQDPSALTKIELNKSNPLSEEYDPMYQDKYQESSQNSKSRSKSKLKSLKNSFAPKETNKNSFQTNKKSQSPPRLDPENNQNSQQVQRLRNQLDINPPQSQKDKFSNSQIKSFSISNKSNYNIQNVKKDISNNSTNRLPSRNQALNANKFAKQEFPTLEQASNLPLNTDPSGQTNNFKNPRLPDNPLAGVSNAKMQERRTQNARRFYGNVQYQPEGQANKPNFFNLNPQVNQKEKDEVFSEAMDNLKKFYDVKKNILYVKSLKEEQKLIAHEKIKLTSQMPLKSVPLLMLNSRQLSQLIYKENRKLNIRRLQALLQKNVGGSREMLQNDFDIRNQMEYEQDQVQEKGEDFFMTNAGQEEQYQQDEIEDDGQDEASNQRDYERDQTNQGGDPITMNTGELPHLSNQFGNTYQPGFMQDVETVHRNQGLNKTEQDKFQRQVDKVNQILQMDDRKPWLRRRNRRFKDLKIDYKTNKFPVDYDRPLSNQEKMRRVFNHGGNRKASREGHFIPTLKSKRHPQLAKIESYFKDCNIDYIPSAPLIKIPGMFQVDQVAKVQLPYSNQHDQ